MIKKIFIKLALITLIGCSDSTSNKETELLKKENDLLKRELELEKNSKPIVVEHNKKQKQSKEDAVISVLDLLSVICESYSFDINGNIKMDLGSASTGRSQFNLHKVKLTYELRPEEPGCADMCPPRLLLKIVCKSGDCITDPSLDILSSGSSIMAIYKIKEGKQLVEELKKFQQL